MCGNHMLVKVIGALVAMLSTVTLAQAQTPAPVAPARTLPQWTTDLLIDRKARRVNDLVTVVVTESIQAAGSADATTSKGSGAGLSLLGRSAKPMSSDTKFAGAGSTSRTAVISAVMTARVVERQSNGDLRIEAIRELFINGDRQTATLAGIIRTADIMDGNMVPSTAVGDLHISYHGSGLVKDNLSPGWLIRFLNRVF